MGIERSAERFVKIIGGRKLQAFFQIVGVPDRTIRSLIKLRYRSRLPEDVNGGFNHNRVASRDRSASDHFYLYRE